MRASLVARRGAESDAQEPEAAQIQVFGSAEVRYSAEEYAEADKYIFAGKCKRNVFWKIVLPSGVEIPRLGRIRGRTLLA